MTTTTTTMMMMMMMMLCLSFWISHSWSLTNISHAFLSADWPEFLLLLRVTWRSDQSGIAYVRQTSAEDEEEPGRPAKPQMAVLRYWGGRIHHIPRKYTQWLWGVWPQIQVQNVVCKCGVWMWAQTTYPANALSDCGNYDPRFRYRGGRVLEWEGGCGGSPLILNITKNL